MSHEYNPKEIEKKWQDTWEEQGIYTTPESKAGAENMYLLSEFPYPSGNLHVGHWYAFAMPDIYARFKRMQGYNVLYPIGFDSFGLPAENAAIKRGLDPKKWTYENMDYMRKQLRSMGASFDWSREIATSDPEFYKWTQWMFTQFFKNDLVYRATTKVNWCEQCKTILANEQVVAGKCERCGYDVIQKDMAQWMLRITKFADDLIDDLDTLDWDESIKQAQREWIGRKEGSLIPFEIVGKGVLDVFTTRADTLFGVTYIVLAPEHEKLSEWKDSISNWDEVEAYIQSVAKKSELDRQQSKEKTGIQLEGITAINPATKEPIPVWIADYVLAGFGTGAVMAVPAHDERDAEFALKYDLPFKFVILPSAGEIGNSRPLVTTGENAFILSAGAIEEKGQKQINAEWNAMYDCIGDCENGILPKGKQFCCTFEGKLINSSRKSDPIFLGFNHPKEGKKWQEKRRVYAFIKQKNKDLYLALKSKTDGTQGLVTGGIEENEKAEEAVVREILEETGYTASILNKQNFKIHDKYYSTNKDINVSSIGDVFVLEIGDIDNIQNINEEEKNKHEPIWLSKQELISFINPPSHKYILSKIFSLPISLDSNDLEQALDFNLRTSEDAKKLITKSVGGKLTKTYRLRDWGMSRQRYWGTPIPVVYDPDGNPHAIPDEHLPWILPTDVDHTPDGTAPLARSQELKERTEKIFGAGWTPEVDTMDTFIDSSWYFYRYLDPKNYTQFADTKRMNNWMPISLYFGGSEHTTMHLLYSRFWVKALHSLGLVPYPEPYKGRSNRGLILGPDGQKMSKSKGNVIDPDEVVSYVGADAVRMYLAFIGPFNEPGNYPWDPNGVVGVKRFLERVWRLKEKVTDIQSDESFLKSLHQTIKKVSEDIERLKFNTAISHLMTLLNQAEKLSHVYKDDYGILLQLLAPMAPHITEELWSQYYSDSIHQSVFPTPNEKYLKQDEITLAIQINGKVRSSIQFSIDIDEETLRQKVLVLPEVQKWIENKEIKKFIYIPEKIINIVV